MPCHFFLSAVKRRDGWFNERGLSWLAIIVFMLLESVEVINR